VERLPAGHGGGGDRPPELLVDGEGENNRISGGVLRQGEGSGGRRQSCDGEEEEGAKLNVPRKKSGKKGLGLRSPWTSSRRRRRPDSDGGVLGQHRSALDTDDGAVGKSAREARRWRGSDSGGAVGTAVGTPARGPDSALKARERRGMGAWQPRGDGVLTGRPGTESGG
jgi:hypothetical protein